PGLYYFRPRSLRIERFRFHEEDPLWVYNITTKKALPVQGNNLQGNSKLRNLDTHSQAFASSIVVPFRPDQTNRFQSIDPPKQLDQIFARINAYLENNVGYLQLFYGYTINSRLKKRDTWDTEDMRPRLTRLFYGPDSTPERPRPRMAAY